MIRIVLQIDTLDWIQYMNFQTDATNVIRAVELLKKFTGKRALDCVDCDSEAVLSVLTMQEQVELCTILGIKRSYAELFWPSETSQTIKAIYTTSLPTYYYKDGSSAI